MQRRPQLLRLISPILLALAFLALAINATRRPTSGDPDDLKTKVEYTIHRAELNRLLTAKEGAEKKRDDAIRRVRLRSEAGGLDPTGPINEIRSIWAKPIAELDAAINEETATLENLRDGEPHQGGEGTGPTPPR